MPPSDPAAPDPFAEFISELSDGKRWALLRADGWDDFIRRLSELIAELPVRRRQAIMMLLFALAYEQLTPEAAREWFDQHDVSDDAGIEAMISWLRPLRPTQAPPDLA